MSALSVRFVAVNWAPRRMSNNIGVVGSSRQLLRAGKEPDPLTCRLACALNGKWPTWASSAGLGSCPTGQFLAGWVFWGYVLLDWRAGGAWFAGRAGVEDAGAVGQFYRFGVRQIAAVFGGGAADDDDVALLQRVAAPAAAPE